MAQVNLPMTLGAAYWDKQKAALAKVAKPPATKLPDELKALTRLHLGVDWNAFGADKLDDVDAAKARLAEFEAAVKGKVAALAEQAKTVETAASKFETEARKDKAFPKETLTAVAAIVKAAKEYAADIDAAVAEARKGLNSKATALAAQKAKADTAGGAGGVNPKLVKLAKAKLLSAISLIRKPKPGARTMRFIVVQGKTSATVMLGVSVGPAQDKMLKSLIAAEAPFKTLKDAAGSVVWEKNALTFVSDRLASGVLKKVQLWLKQALKLNMKLRLRNSAGVVEETAGEELSDAMLQVDPADAMSADDAREEYEERLALLAAAIRKAMAHPTGARIKALMAGSAQAAKADKYDHALASLDEIEALLDEGGFSDPLGDDDGAAVATPTVGASAEAKQKALAAAMDDWKTRRAAAVASLKEVAARIASAKHARSTSAILEIQAVMKNLTPEPATLQQVTELRDWLGSDDVVNDVCELASDVRTPLMVPLERMRALLAA